MTSGHGTKNTAVVGVFTNNKPASAWVVGDNTNHGDTAGKPGNHKQ
jgi:hypothetical protein